MVQLAKDKFGQFFNLGRWIRLCIDVKALASQQSWNLFFRGPNWLGVHVSLHVLVWKVHATDEDLLRLSHCPLNGARDPHDEGLIFGAYNDRHGFIAWARYYKFDYFLHEKQATMKLYFYCVATGIADLISYNRLLNNIENRRHTFKTNDRVLLQYVDFFCCAQRHQTLHLLDGVPFQCDHYRKLARGFSFSLCN